MTDEKSGAPSRAPAAAGVAALIAAAVIAIAPHTALAEGEVSVGYLDPAGIPTACTGHTGPDVRVGIRYSREQCRAWFVADMTKAMKGAIAAAPPLVDNAAALRASGDFAFNAGGAAFAGSPMAAAFARRDWANGCNAFAGYYAASTFKAPQPRYQCRPKKGGGYLCQLPGLVKRRLDEQAICLGRTA